MDLQIMLLRDKSFIFIGGISRIWSIRPFSSSLPPQSRYGFGRKLDICTPINMIIPLAVRQFITCSSAGVLYDQQGAIRSCFSYSRRKFLFFELKEQSLSFLLASGNNPLPFFLLQETPFLFFQLKETISFFSSCSRREYISFLPVS